MKARQQKIYVNGKFLAKPKTGVQRFAHEILTALDNIISQSETYRALNFICLAPRMDNAANLPQWKNINITQHRYLSGNLWEQAALPWQARDGLLMDLCNIGPIFHPAQVAVIHDASVFTVPEVYTAAFRIKYKLTYFVLARTALRLITVSQFSRCELSRYIKVDADKIFVIPEGCEHILREKADSALLEKHNLQKGGYFLAVGSASPHKNLSALVMAMEQTDKNLPPLVVAGGSFAKVFRNQKIHSTDKLINVGYVHDAQLRALYENALAFVFPSLYEGFGLPPLEAMRCGCPVIASSRASLPEICADAALYFDPLNTAEIADCLTRVAGSKELQETLSRKGLAHAQQFSWQKAGRALLDMLVGVTDRK